jgi:hypothetical protein
MHSAEIKEGEKQAQVLWSEEGNILLKRLKEKGLSWEKIVKSFPGRTLYSCKQRYNKYLNEGEKQGQALWSKEHSLLLKKLKEESKGLSWGKIAKSFQGRTVRSCTLRYHKMKGAIPRSKGAARNRHRDSNDSSDDDEENSSSSNEDEHNNSDNDDEDSNSSNNEDDGEEVAAASDPSPSPPLDDDVLPPVISSSFSAALTYYPPPLPPRKQRRKFSFSGARRDERLIGEFCCWICTRLIFRAQVLHPCGCHVFCKECVPPLDARTSACSTCSTPFEQALPYRTGNNIAEQMVRAKFVEADVAAEWKNRGA